MSFYSSISKNKNHLHDRVLVLLEKNENLHFPIHTIIVTGSSARISETFISIQFQLNKILKIKNLSTNSSFNNTEVQHNKNVSNLRFDLLYFDT